jgi:putative NIF3 family GTP cyclohydrolase 1 type 2
MQNQKFPGGRRKFLSTALSALAVSSFPFSRLLATAPPFTVQQVIDALLADIPGAPFPHTVDTIKTGDPGQAVKGIVTTMFATGPVIDKTIGLNANFIIAHEPTFFNHADETDWLKDDPVYQAKRDLLDKHNIVIWRFHDGIHAHKPDGIRMGVLADLGWQDYYAEGSPMVALPETFPLGTLIEYMKRRLGIDHLRYIGDLSQLCTKVVLSPGAAGGRSQIGMIEKYQPDLFVCGELNEWETSEYIRDAQYQGRKIALVVLGHCLSEEPGMEWLVPILKQKVPGIPVTHLPSGDPFSFS